MIAGAGEACSAGVSVVTGVGAVVYVVEADAYVAVAAVVPEASAAPVSAVEAYAEVAEAVINAAVVADVWAPVTGVPEVAVGSVAPVARVSEGVDEGRQNPCAVDPDVAIRGPGPVAGGPDVAVAGGDWLGVVGDGRGRDLSRTVERPVSNIGLLILSVGLLVRIALPFVLRCGRRTVLIGLAVGLDLGEKGMASKPARAAAPIEFLKETRERHDFTFLPILRLPGRYHYTGFRGRQG